MPTLLEMQTALSRSLLSGEPCELSALITATGANPESRLNIHRNTMRGTLTTALRLAYPAVHRLVGAGFFETVAEAYIKDHQPRSAYLNGYDEDFSDFLENVPDASHLEYLSGVARLDWAVNRALHAPEVEGLDPNALSTVSPEKWETLRFTAHPSVGFVHSRYPVDQIWQGVLLPDTLDLRSLDLGSGPVWLAVHRVEGDTRVERLDQSAWVFAYNLCAALPLGTCMEDLSDEEASTKLGGCLANQFFSGYQI